jgi:hypothetical protein
MDTTAKDFKKARDYMEKILTHTIKQLEIGIYDPLLKYVFEEELKKMLTRQFKSKYPDFSVNFSFQIYLAEQIIEYSVQRFYHPFSMHTFLGSVRDRNRERNSTIKPFLVDCYYSSLYEVFGEPRIIVRYGHGRNEMCEAGMGAAEEFFKGLNTPLAQGYQLAIEAGYIKK